jgi:hypothetical protein
MLRQRRTFFSPQDGFAKSMAALTNRIYPDSPLIKSFWALVENL